MHLHGFTIIESTDCVEQFRFPRSKKKRIRAKWARRAENSRPMRHALQQGSTLYCHPTFAARLRRAVETRASALM
jgi:hypothetical protein